MNATDISKTFAAPTPKMGAMLYLIGAYLLYRIALLVFGLILALQHPAEKFSLSTLNLLLLPEFFFAAVLLPVLLFGLIKRKYYFPYILNAYLLLSIISALFYLINLLVSFDPDYPLFSPRDANIFIQILVTCVMSLYLFFSQRVKAIFVN